MLLDITELLSVNGLKETFQVRYEQDSFKKDGEVYPVSESPAFELTIANMGNRKLQIQGDGRVALLMPCARCLEQVEIPVEFSLDRRVNLNVENLNQADEDLEEMCYIDGCRLDADALIHTEILINLPISILCSENCKGLCPKCGADLNKGECGCSREQLDPRMAVIRDIFKDFKEV